MCAGTVRSGPARCDFAFDIASHFFRYHGAVNNGHRKLLEKLFADPLNGNIEWSRIESVLRALGCRVIQGAGSSVTFEHSGRRLTVHRPHPQKAALRYRVQAVREFLQKIGVTP